MNEFKFISDKYRDNRGGYSRCLNIYCDHCGTHILLYQKDGPGPLKRLYLDRIFAPKNLAELKRLKSVKSVPNLFAKSARELSGYHLFTTKKIGWSIYY